MHLQQHLEIEFALLQATFLRIFESLRKSFLFFLALFFSTTQWLSSILFFKPSFQAILKENTDKLQQTKVPLSSQLKCPGVVLYRKQRRLFSFTNQKFLEKAEIDGFFFVG